MLFRSGPNGLDSAYVTLTTEQPELGPTGNYLSGAPISGNKTVTGIWNFGYDPLQVGNPANIRDNAPRSYTTNDKFQYAGGFPSPTVPQKFTALNAADIVTKEVLDQWVTYLFDTLEIDNGVYESITNPTCHNYSSPGSSDIICPV